MTDILTHQSVIPTVVEESTPFICCRFIHKGECFRFAQVSIPLRFSRNDEIKTIISKIPH